MICEDIIKSYLDALQREFHCRQAANDRLSIVTPYFYPDHDNIEIFVRLKDGGDVVVSDRGETLRGLDTLGLDVVNTPNAFFAARRIAEGFGVSVERGVLVKRGQLSNVGSLVFDVILTCQSVGSLVYGSRAYEPAIFKDEIGDYLEGRGLNFQENVKETGTSGKEYNVDFYISTPNYGYWISTISPKNRAGVGARINYNFRMWSDLAMPPDRKLTLLNDELLPFRQEDIRILERVSTIHRWTKRQSLVNAIQAGNPPVSPETRV